MFFRLDIFTLNLDNLGIQRLFSKYTDVYILFSLRGPNIVCNGCVYVFIFCVSIAVSTFGDADWVLVAGEGGARVERVVAQVPWRRQYGGAAEQCAEVAVLCQSQQGVIGRTACVM